MSAPPAAGQKPLLLPGIAPHLFQSRMPTHRRRSMILDKNSSPPAGPSPDHGRTPSNESTTVVAGDDVDLRLQAVETRLAAKIDALAAQMDAGFSRMDAAAAPRPALLTLLIGWLTNKIWASILSPVSCRTRCLFARHSIPSFCITVLPFALVTGALPVFPGLPPELRADLAVLHLLHESRHDGYSPTPTPFSSLKKTMFPTLTGAAGSKSPHSSYWGEHSSSASLYSPSLVSWMMIQEKRAKEQADLLVHIHTIQIILEDVVRDIVGRSSEINQMIRPITERRDDETGARCCLLYFAEARAASRSAPTAALSIRLEELEITGREVNQTKASETIPRASSTLIIGNSCSATEPFPPRCGNGINFQITSVVRSAAEPTNCTFFQLQIMEAEDENSPMTTYNPILSSEPRFCILKLQQNKQSFHQPHSTNISHIQMLLAGIGDSFVEPLSEPILADFLDGV
ncbi:hypothetical protein C8J57DRAFT_1241527 [Mycena rebaudengoi]|nr:hypothetical protein C8J57DRAFT_1241527 [Mycena rebaudengoi]